MDCSLPGSSVHGRLQTRILEWGAISSSRPRTRTQEATRKAWGIRLNKCLLKVEFFPELRTSENLIPLKRDKKIKRTSPTPIPSPAELISLKESEKLSHPYRLTSSQTFLSQFLLGKPPRFSRKSLVFLVVTFDPASLPPSHLVRCYRSPRTNLMGDSQHITPPAMRLQPVGGLHLKVTENQ